MKFSLIVLVVLLTCSTTQAYKQATSQHYSLYLCTLYNQEQKKTKRAQECYAQLFKLKAPIYIYAGYFEHLFGLEHYTAIFRLIPQTKGYFDDQKNIQVIIGQVLELVGKKYEAENIFINLYEHCKEQADVAYYAAAAYARRKAFSQSLTIIDDYLNSSIQRPTHFMFYFLRSKIYQVLKNEKEAIVNLKKGLELYKSIRGVALTLPINTSLSLVSQTIINEAYYIFNTSLEYTTSRKQQRKLIALWKKLHS